MFPLKIVFLLCPCTVKLECLRAHQTRKVKARTSFTMKIWARTYDQKVPPSYSSLNQLCLLTLGPHQEGLLAQSHLPPSRMKATSPARTLTPGCKPSPSELRSPSTTLHGQEVIDIKHSHNFPYPICICGYQKMRSWQYKN